MWWNQRRPEIVETSSERYSAASPANVPNVTWEVTKTAEAQSVTPRHWQATRWARGQRLYPDIQVHIQMTLVVPAGRKGPVPVMMMFGGRTIPEVAFPAPAFPGRGGRPGGAPGPGVHMAAPANADPPALEQLIADGWGVATINPVVSRPTTEPV